MKSTMASQLPVENPRHSQLRFIVCNNNKTTTKYVRVTDRHFKDAKPAEVWRDPVHYLKGRKKIDNLETI